MNLSNLRRYFKSREKEYPRLVGLLRRLVKRLSGGTGPAHPRIMGREIGAVAAVLRSTSWNMNYGGDLAHEKLEEEFAEYVGTRYAVAVNTGGMAIQMALRAFGVKPGDEVIHQVDTCVADAFAVIAAGGTPIFGDINKDDFMLSGDSVLSQLSPQTKVLMPVHMWGNVENMDLLVATAKKNNLYVVEDACLALGAEWKGKRVGSVGDAGVFSLGCLKPIQAGEGGIIVTNDEALAKELRTIRNWGDMSSEYGVRDQKTLSWNGRISEIVAAVALEQLRAYPKQLERLRESVNVFIDHLKNMDGIEVAVRETPELKPAYSQVVVKLDSELLGMSKSDLMEELGKLGIRVWHANFEPINTLSFFRNGYWRDWIINGNVQNAERNYGHRYAESEEVFQSLGMGFPRNYFLSKHRVESLVKGISRVLLKK